MTEFPSARVSSALAAASVDSRQRASRRVVFGLVAVALIMSSLDGTIVATALPTLHRVLHAPINWAGWTITAYQLGLIIAMPVAGRISDLYGRKRVYLACIIGFTVSSLACGLAGNIYVLVALRVLQGLGGGAFMPCATGIVADHFGRDRDRAIGMFSSIFTLGSMVGPVIGGVLISYWSWRGIFFINVPVGIVLVLLVIRFLPRTPPREIVRPDLVGIALLAMLVLVLMFAITSLGAGDISPLSPVVILLVGASAVLFGVFWHHSTSVPSPLIPLRLLKERSFATMNIVNAIFGGVVLGVGALVPLYAEERFHMASLDAGTLLTARAVGSILVAGVVSFLLRRIGYRLPMLVGFLLTSAGMVLLALTPHGISNYGWLAFAAAVVGIGSGIATPATNNALLAFVPEEAASVAGLRGMFKQTGSVLTISVTTAVVARSMNEGVALGHSFIVFAIAALVMVPLVMSVPNHRGTW